jgi:hypothetical protein
MPVRVYCYHKEGEMNSLAFDEIVEFSFAGAMVCTLLTVVAMPVVTMFF